MITVLPGLENPESTYSMPEHIREAIVDYAQHHHERGHFVMAVLRNNLLEAATRADAESSACLPEIVRFVYNEIPGNIHELQPARAAGTVDKWLGREFHTYVCRNAGCDGETP